MRDKTRTRGVRRVVALAILVLTAALAGSASATAAGARRRPAAAADRRAELGRPGRADVGGLQAPCRTARPEFYDGSADGSQNQYRTAIILVDYPDQPFLITQPPGTHPFGNPQPGWTPVAPADVAEWMHDYYAVPNQYNGGKTLHGYWMEDSHGKIGVDVEVFGPYTMAAQVVRVRAGDGLQLRGREPGQLGLSRRAHLQPEHPHRRRQRLACRDRLRRRDTVASTTSSTSPPATTSRRRGRSSARCSGPTASRSRRKFGPPGAEDGPVLNAAGQSDPELGADPLRAVDVVAGGREPLAERGRRHVDAGGELRARASSRTSSATCAGCRTTTTTRSATPTGTTPATGR